MLNALYFPADRSRLKKVEVSVVCNGAPTDVQHLSVSDYFEGRSPNKLDVTKYPSQLPIPLDYTIVLFYEKPVKNKVIHSLISNHFLTIIKGNLLVSNSIMKLSKGHCFWLGNMLVMKRTSTSKFVSVTTTDRRLLEHIVLRFDSHFLVQMKQHLFNSSV